MENSIDKALQQLSEALKSEAPNEQIAPVSFVKDVWGKGFLWKGQGSTKQLVLSPNPERIFSSEHLELAKDKVFLINGVKVLDTNELGTSVVKSNLREVGRLKGLIVDGSLSVNQYLYYDATTDRLGLGIDEPNGAFSVAENGIEVMLGTREYTDGMVGTYASTNFHIVTDNTSRISVNANGDINLGNENKPPIKVGINGKLSVGVSNPDPNVDLHVKGAVKFNGVVHIKATHAPQGGTYNVGDICWNSKPKQKDYVGWICVQAGTPGLWCSFGEIR